MQVTFEEHDGKTRLPPRRAGIPSGMTRDVTDAGWNEALDKLAEAVGGKQ